MISKVSTNGAKSMDKKVASERLRALASNDKKRSKAARLRDVIDDVEACLSAGVSRSAVVEELACLGLEMTLTTFETTLKRIRLKRGQISLKAGKQSGHSIDQNANPREAAQGAGISAEPQISSAGSHNPADLDKIIGAKPDLNALEKLAKRKKK